MQVYVCTVTVPNAAEPAAYTITVSVWLFVFEVDRAEIDGPASVVCFVCNVDPSVFKYVVSVKGTTVCCTVRYERGYM